MICTEEMVKHFKRSEVWKDMQKYLQDEVTNRTAELVGLDPALFPTVEHWKARMLILQGSIATLQNSLELPEILMDDLTNEHLEGDDNDEYNPG